MKYLIVQDWINTTNNHAGMKYLAWQIKRIYPKETNVYEIPDYWGLSYRPNHYNNSLGFFYEKLKYRLFSIYIKLKFKRCIKNIQKKYFLK